ncbi:MAG: c-type cytochrome, partial [Acidobacteria bacterium]|nr:c-type cytochrome [Acidobacteriota bacterium]
MKRISRGPVRIRWAVAIASCALIAAWTFSLTGQARQTRSVSDGVYTAEQAQRGQALYKTQCLACHGDKLQGVVGPMLAG